MDEATKSLVVIVLAVWGSATSTLKLAEAANKVRNQILIGMIDGQEITLSHRRLLLRNDWLPIKSAGVITNLFLSLALLGASLASQEGDVFSYSLAISALAPLIGAVFFSLGVSDYHAMKMILATAENA